MANVTDPLARPIHGTNPQNLIEYITRQRIYDSQFWKEHLFGCTAKDVVEKAAIQVKAVGGSYGGNSKPTRFLSLLLKMLQIQPEDGIVDELVMNENFKYVRALGAFYLRMTGRPAEIYEKLESIYSDYRKLRYRSSMNWSLVHMDEFIDELLTKDTVCGIALPRLPRRDVLVESGYLEAPRQSVQNFKLDVPTNDLIDEEKVKLCIEGKEKIKALLREKNNNCDELCLSTLTESTRITAGGKSFKRNIDTTQQKKEIIETKKKRRTSEANTKQKNKKYGSLFKSSKLSGKEIILTEENNDLEAKNDFQPVDNDSLECWNRRRHELGLKPLKNHRS